jgi:plasmid stability protein
MPTLTVRDIDEETMRRLRAVARANNRSLSAEVRHVLAGHARAEAPHATGQTNGETQKAGAPHAER